MCTGLVLYFGDMLAHTLSKVSFIQPRTNKIVAKLILSIYPFSYFFLPLGLQMEFSMSSKAFIHTPGTRSDMTTIIQVEMIFIV